LAEKFQVLVNILHPSSLKRDFKEYVLDTGKPLAAGLRSFAKVVGGQMIHRTCKPILPGPNMVGMVASFPEGSAQRQKNGGLLIYLKIRGPYDQLNEWARTLGLEVVEFSSDDQFFSDDPKNPTNFIGDASWTIQAGTSIPDIVSGKSVHSPIAMQVSIKTKATGILKYGKFSGKYDLETAITTAFALIVPNVHIALTGDFEVQLE
jgi:hypothetical protein